MANTYKLILILLIAWATTTHAQSWTQTTAFPGEGRHHPITFSNDEAGYVVCGSYRQDMFRYDKVSKTWTQLGDFPAQGRGYSYAVTSGNIAFMGLGSTQSGLYPRDWWAYNMDSDTWERKADLPAAGRNHPAMICVGNKILMGCGSNDNGNLNDWWEYDIPSNTWSAKPNLPGLERHHPFYFGIGDYAYVGMGHGTLPGPGTNPNTGVNIYSDFYRYNPANSTWQRLGDFPGEARVAGTQFTYNGKGYVLSGDGDNHGPLGAGEMWSYSPANDSWSQLPAHPGNAIWAPGNFVIDCSVYFLLGQDNVVSALPTSVYTYKLGEECGCTNPAALNYSAQAIYDDGSCCFIGGCTARDAANYDPNACVDDGSCIPAVLGCNNPAEANYNPLANVTSFRGGAYNKDFGTGGYFYNNQHLIFNSAEACRIVSADVDIEVNNTVTFELRDANSNVLDDTTYTLSPGPQRIELNFDVPAGNNLQLGIANGNSGLYRNSSGADYPYNIADMITITSSSANDPEYYYFFYDIEVEALCNDPLTSIEPNVISEPKLLRITNLLGQEVDVTTGEVLLYHYDDGSVQKLVLVR